MENLGDAAGSSVQENPEEKRNGLVKRMASVSNQMIKRFTWVSEESKPARLDRSKSTTGQALRGLKFISKADGGAGWTAVEKRFEMITKTTDGLLIRSKFGECIGMKSKDFASVLFDALARRRHMRGDVIDKDMLKDFWEQISDQKFDSRLMTFFDMMDKDGNGRLTEDEVREIINLSSSTNNLSTIQKKADEYAAMIMEELDPHNMGYIMVIAVGITIGVVIHSVAHLACDFPRLIAATPEEYKPLGKYFGEEQPKRYSHFVKSTEGITGLVMVLLMAIAFTLALPWFRRGKLEKTLPGPLKKLASFNAFWYTHHMFVVVYILLIVHGYYVYLSKEWYKKTTWMYLAVPVALYACERLIRAFRSSIRTVRVVTAAAYPGNVLTLKMSRPKQFDYKSGQYMFVNCPAVSPFEWHPFSITSAPQDDYLSVHIKSAGDWTRAIKGVFSEVTSKPPPVGNMLPGANDPDYPKIMIDGPYGAPAQEYKKHEVVLLVGLGIGATPMISIIKDIINNIDAKEHAQLNLMENGSQQEPQNKKEKFKTRRAYFYWVTREQGSYDWFKNIMNEIAERDKSKVIELHNYCTSVYEEDDARSALIHMLQSISYAKSGRDVVSETRVKSHFSKPNWEDVFKQIAMNHPNTNVGVFYCGLPVLTKELRRLALEFTHKTNTRFSFHKENF